MLLSAVCDHSHGRLTQQQCPHLWFLAFAQNVPLRVNDEVGVVSHSLFRLAELRIEHRILILETEQAGVANDLATL